MPEYWIFDLNGETLEVCHEPQNGGYAQRWVLAADAQASPLEISTQHSLVGDLLALKYFIAELNDMSDNQQYA